MSISTHFLKMVVRTGGQANSAEAYLVLVSYLLVDDVETLLTLIRESRDSINIKEDIGISCLTDAAQVTRYLYSSLP